MKKTVSVFAVLVLFASCGQNNNHPTSVQTSVGSPGSIQVNTGDSQAVQATINSPGSVQKINK